MAVRSVGSSDLDKSTSPISAAKLSVTGQTVMAMGNSLHGHLTLLEATGEDKTPAAQSRHWTVASTSLLRAKTGLTLPAKSAYSIAASAVVKQRIRRVPWPS